jgi:hypothetical protein
MRSSRSALRALLVCLLVVSFYGSLTARAADLNGEHASGRIDFDVQFGLSRQYDEGVQTSVALHVSGLVLEFHKTQSAVESGIWYHVGTLLGMSVTWGGSQYSGVSGYWPSVAISKEGYVILVFSDQPTKNGSNLIYRVGKINPSGDHNQTITWLTESMHWDKGFHSSIAINASGVIVGVHETGHASDGMYYRVGHLRNPAGGDYTIQWDSPSWGVYYDDGINPHIAINNFNQVVAVHQVPGEHLLHYWRGTVTGGTIHFAQSRRYDESAERPAVALLDNGLVLAVHSLGGLVSRRGWLSLSNSWEIEWSPAKKEDHNDRIEYPALAANGTYAIQTHLRNDGTIYKDLYFSTSAIRDRANWMRDNLSWLGDKTLQDIVIPATHDAGMYRADDFGILALTQDQSVYDQLRGGVRYFDLRVLAGNPQYIYHGSSWTKGPPLHEVLHDVKRFMQEGHQEAVMLLFSHFKDFADCTTDRLSPEYSTLVSSLFNTLGPWLYYNTTGDVRPAHVPLSEMLSGGGKVIALVQGNWASVLCQPEPYIFVYKDWSGEALHLGLFNVFDMYSDMRDYDSMRGDQFQKYAVYNGRMKWAPSIECDLFVFSWTLTPIAVEDVQSTSEEANRNLANEMNSVHRNPYGFIPNMLFVDYYQYARVTDTAISMTERFLNHTFSNFTLVKGSSKKVYVVLSNYRHWIPDEVTFDAMGFNWHNILSFSDDVVNTLPEGVPFPSVSPQSGPLKYPNGTLVKGSSPQVYVVLNDARHWIPNPGTFDALGYNWEKILVLPDNVLNSIPEGPPFPSVAR